MSRFGNNTVSAGVPGTHSSRGVAQSQGANVGSHPGLERTSPVAWALPAVLGWLPTWRALARLSLPCGSHRTQVLCSAGLAAPPPFQAPWPKGSPVSPGRRALEVPALLVEEGLGETVLLTAGFRVPGFSVLLPCQPRGQGGAPQTSPSRDLWAEGRVRSQGQCSGDPVCTWGPGRGFPLLPNPSPPSFCQAGSLRAHRLSPGVLFTCSAPAPLPPIQRAPRQLCPCRLLPLPASSRPAAAVFLPLVLHHSCSPSMPCSRAPPGALPPSGLLLDLAMVWSQITFAVPWLGSLGSLILAPKGPTSRVATAAGPTRTPSSVL